MHHRPLPGPQAGVREVGNAADVVVVGVGEENVVWQVAHALALELGSDVRAAVDEKTPGLPCDEHA